MCWGLTLQRARSQLTLQRAGQSCGCECCGGFSRRADRDDLEVDEVVPMLGPLAKRAFDAWRVGADAFAAHRFLTQGAQADGGRPIVNVAVHRQSARATSTI